MKMILCILVAAVAVGFSSCESKDKGKLDPSAKVYISPAAGVQLQAPTKAGHLTAREIVEQAQGIRTAQWTMAVDDWNRDLINNRFNVSASWAIAQDGTLETGLIEARDYIFVTLNEENRPKDTIAYIPNVTMQVAEQAVKAAYAAESYSECYRLLQEGFVFKPTTGAEWRALKAKNEN